MLCLSLVVGAGHVQAQSASFGGNAGTLRTTLYIGGGKARSTGNFENDTPFSVGIMHQLANNRWIVGANPGREGAMIDSTWGQNSAPKQATSLNLLVGRNLVQSGSMRVNVALLAGVRE